MISDQGRPVYVFVGGRGGKGVTVYDECHVYDVRGYPSDEIKVPPLPEERAWAAVLSNKDTIYVVGGRPTGTIQKGVPSKSLFMFTLSSMMWTQLSDMHVARTFHTACLVGDQIVVTGGITGENRMTRNTECYHIRDDAWHFGQDYLRRTEAVDPGVTEAASCAWRGQCVVSGGWRKTVGCYDIQADQWTHLADMVHGRRGHSMACVNDCLYVFGGSLHDNIEMYDPKVGQFTVIADMGVKIYHTNAVAYGSKVILAGGNENSINFFFTYDVHTNEISTRFINMSADLLQGQVALLYIAFPRLQELCCLTVFKVLDDCLGHGNQQKRVGINQLKIPQMIKTMLLEIL